MDVVRRDFLRGLSVGLGGMALPGWLLDGAQAQDPAARPGAARRRQLRQATRRAMGRGRPLLVLVVPAKARDYYQRGQRLGVLLNHGGPEVLRDLALAEPVCASAAELKAELGLVAKVADPFLICIEFGKGKPRLSAAPVPPEVELGTKPLERDRRKIAAAQKVALRKELEQSRRALRALLAKDPGAIANHADRMRSKLAADESEILNTFLSGRGKLSDKQALHFAAALRFAALGSKDQRVRQQLLDRVSRAAEAVLVKQPLPGSRWAHDTGCGLRIEGSKDLGMGLCGMGHVPQLARRFLYLYPTPK